MDNTVSIRMLKELLDEAIHNGLENHPVYIRLGKDNREDVKFLKYQVGRDGFFEIICEDNELNDSNEKLVHACCQYEKCFDLLKRLYESAESGSSDFYDCYFDVEQFIKENE